MVKIGFICEGKTEALLLSSEKFKQLLSSKQLQSVDVIDAQGSGNLLPHNIAQYIQALEVSGAQKIIILTDLDKDVCISLTKQRISARPQDIVVVSVKQIEAWFLASTMSMQWLLNDDTFYFDKPESELVPFDTIRKLMISKTNRGIAPNSSGKITLVKRLVEKYGLEITEAASHANCPSAKYFVDKLISLIQ